MGVYLTKPPETTDDKRQSLVEAVSQALGVPPWHLCVPGVGRAVCGQHQAWCLCLWESLQHFRGVSCHILGSSSSLLMGPGRDSSQDS